MKPDHVDPANGPHYPRTVTTGSGETSSRDGLLWGGALAAVTALAAHTLSAGLAPPSLWVDDLWPVVLAEEGTLEEIFEIRAPVSPFFVLLLRGAGALAPAGDLAYQLIAFLSALACIPLVGAVARQATGSRWIGVSAAALWAANPLVLTYAVRVKQFTLEALAVALLLAIGFRRRGEAPAWPACAGAALLAPLAFTTVFFSLPLCTLLALRRRSRGDLAAWIALLIVIALCFFGLMAPRANEALQAYWQDYYLDAEDGMADDMGNLAGLLTNAFPSGFGALALLALPGIWWIAQRHRDTALAMAGMYLLILAAAVADRFPVGTGRTEIFTFPVTIVLAAAGAHWLIRRDWRAEAAVAFACLLLFAARAAGHDDAYLRTNDRTVVELANRHVRDGDAMIVYPYSTWAVAHYGRWSERLVPSDQTTVAYYAVPERERTLVLQERPRGVDFRADREVVESQLAPFLRSAPPRVWLVATSADPLPNRWIVESLRNHGYVIAQARGFRGAGFALFVRNPNAP